MTGCNPRTSGQHFRVGLALFLAASCASPTQGQTTTPAVQVELNREKPLHLRVTLRSGASRTAKFYRSELPWGNRYSLTFSALPAGGGQPLDLLYYCDLPGPTEVSIGPRETLTGDIDLRHVIRDLDVLKESDLLLFWAYKSPDALHIPHWSGGMVLIPKQK
jgi:hypothetical protein